MTKDKEPKRDKNKVYPKEVDLNYVFVDLAGYPVPRTTKNADDTETPPEDFTLKDAIIEALTLPEPQNKAVDGKEKMRRWTLAQRIYNSESIMLSADEIVLIKDLVDKRFAAPLVVAQTIQQLDPVAAERA